jgi:hypothetical protein
MNSLSANCRSSCRGLRCLAELCHHAFTRHQEGAREIIGPLLRLGADEVVTLTGLHGGHRVAGAAYQMCGRSRGLPWM